MSEPHNVATQALIWKLQVWIDDAMPQTICEWAKTVQADTPEQYDPLSQLAQLATPQKHDVLSQLDRLVIKADRTEALKVTIQAQAKKPHNTVGQARDLQARINDLSKLAFGSRQNAPFWLSRFDSIVRRVEKRPDHFELDSQTNRKLDEFLEAPTKSARGLSYPIYFAGWFTLWPIVAVAGGQAFSPMLGLMALPVLFFTRPKTVPLYTLAFAAVLLWILTVSTWSNGSPFLSGSLAEGSLTLDSAGVRIVMAGIAAIFAIMGLAHVERGRGQKTYRYCLAIISFHFFAVLVMAVALDPIINMVTSFGHTDYYSTLQNFLRNANSFSLLLPIVAAAAWFSAERNLRRSLIVVLVAASALAFALTGTQSALSGTVFMLMAMLIVKFFPKNGFRILFTSLAGFVLASPVLFSWLIPRMRDLGIPLPGSFFSRSYSWQLVGEKVLEKPLIGHGLEASHKWTETYSDYPVWLAQMVSEGFDERAWSVYRVIPNHPHSMPLQIWAETGAIGASLVAIALVLFGWRLKSPIQWNRADRYAAAGLIGTSAAIFSFAYSMWNEAFWASLAIAAGIIVLQSRQANRR